MDLALIGTGRMGQAVEHIAVARGHRIVARFNSSAPLTRSTSHNLNADAAIDFSAASAVLQNVEACTHAGIPLVIGTTGWRSMLPNVEQLVARSDASILWAPNFSMGVALLAHALRAIVPLVDVLRDWDISIHETHHTAKKDSPSGTALLLSDVILEGVERKCFVQTNLSDARPSPDGLQVSSSRVGRVTGTHEVHIDGAYDHVTLTHDARSREGFAYGSIAAAEWLVGRNGLFSFDHMIDDWTTALQKPVGA